MKKTKDNLEKQVAVYKAATDVMLNYYNRGESAALEGLKKLEEVIRTPEENFKK